MCFATTASHIPPQTTVYVSYSFMLVQANHIVKRTCCFYINTAAMDKL